MPVLKEPKEEEFKKIREKFDNGVYTLANYYSALGFWVDFSFVFPTLKLFLNAVKLSINVNLYNLHGRQNKIRQNGSRRNEY